MIHLSVLPSKINGLGLFTVNRIPKDTLIGVFQSRHIKNQAESDGPYGLHRCDGTVVFMLGNFKYINHLDTPNVQLWDDDSVTSLVDIPAGTELVSHYGEEWLLNQCKADGSKVS